MGILKAVSDGYNILMTAGGPLSGDIAGKARLKISASLTGKKASEETKAKMSLAHTGNKYALGHTHSSETKAKMSLAHIGNKNFLGKIRSDEDRARISKTMKDRKIRCVPVLLFGIEYQSIKSAGIALGKSNNWVNKRAVRVENKAAA